jgi:hypothetical protein
MRLFKRNIYPLNLAHRLLHPKVKFVEFVEEDEEPTLYSSRLLGLSNPQRPFRGTFIPAIDSRGDERMP